MRLRCVPPRAMLIALLASGCPRGGVSTPVSGTAQPRVASDGSGRAGGAPHGDPRARERDPQADPRVPEAAHGGGSPPEPKADELELTFVGDIMFGRYRRGGFEPLADDPSFDPFAEIRTILGSDVVVGNLETPLVEQLPERSPIDTRHRFGASHQWARDRLGDFTVLSLANNHYFDLREDGQRASPRILAEEGIFPIGAARTDEPLHRVETYATKGWRIGFLAVTTLVNVEVRADTPQVPYIELAQMPGELLPLVERARADHDLVVVVVHWGEEYFAAPSLRQRRVARRLLDGGVDMIIGHHPHVLQAIERHETGLVAYSLGNFLFSHTTSLPRLMGVLRTVWRAAPQGAALADSCLVEAVLHPVINDPTPHPHPSPATGEPAEQVRHRIVGLSRRLGTRWKPVEGTEDLRLEGEAGCGRPRSTGAEPGRAPASRSSAPPSRGG